MFFTLTRIHPLHRFALLAMLIIGINGCGSSSTEAPAVTTITTQPSDQSVVNGDTASFTVVANNANSYQWQSSTDVGVTFDDISAATAASYTTAATTLNHSGTQYRVQVNGASNNVTSSAVTLSVTTIAGGPAITVQPNHTRITAPNAGIFNVTATGSSLSYQWQQCQDNNEICASWADISGATLASHSTGVTNVSMSEQRFHVVVSNSVDDVTSATVTLMVDPTPIAPVITLQPINASVVEPAAASFTIAYTAEPMPLPRWQYSNNGIDWFNTGVSDDTLILDPTSSNDTGRQYRVILENAAGSVTSNVVTLTVTATASAPAFTTQPANVTITEGQNAQFSVVVTGTPTPTVQWQLSTDNGSNWSNINGETGSTYSAVAPSQANTGRQFRVVASNSQSSVNSNAATLTVNAPTALLKIVFSRGCNSLNDLHLVNENGTNEITLAGSADDEHYAAISGDRIIYHRITNNQSDLYSVNSSGTDMQILANSTDYETFSGVTASGRVIYRRDTSTNGRDLWSVNADGTNPQVLANSALNDDFRGVTSGGKIIYSVASGNNQSDLYSINADGTGNAVLANDPNYYDFYLGETSTGQFILQTLDSNFFSFGSIFSMDTLGGVTTPIVTNTSASEYDFVRLAQTGQVVIRRTVGTTLVDLYVNSTAIATSTDVETFQGSTTDGKIIYRRLNDSHNDLYMVNVDGSNTVTLAATSSNELFAGLTPDGRVIYTTVTAGLYDIYMVNANGTNTTPVANATDYEEYKGVTADGHIIYERTTGLVTYLYAYNTNNAVTTPLVTSSGHAFFVGITSNNKVLFRRQAGNADLYIINTDGTGSTPLANTTGNEFFGAVMP